MTDVSAATFFESQIKSLQSERINPRSNFRCMKTDAPAMLTHSQSCTLSPRAPRHASHQTSNAAAVSLPNELCNATRNNEHRGANNKKAANDTQGPKCNL